jgi:hypothetical protein
MSPLSYEMGFYISEDDILLIVILTSCIMRTTAICTFGQLYRSHQIKNNVMGRAFSANGEKKDS